MTYTSLLNTSWLPQLTGVVAGALKTRQHAAWPASFSKVHTGLEDLGGIICPAEWRPRHSVADFELCRRLRPRSVGSHLHTKATPLGTSLLLLRFLSYFRDVFWECSLIC